MPARKPASVLPEPVGAHTSVCRPAAIAGHPPSCASVGPSGNRRSNHARTAGWNPSSAPVESAATGVGSEELTATALTLAVPARTPSCHLSPIGPPGHYDRSLGPASRRRAVVGSALEVALNGRPRTRPSWSTCALGTRDEARIWLLARARAHALGPAQALAPSADGPCAS